MPYKDRDRQRQAQADWYQKVKAKRRIQCRNQQAAINQKMAEYKSSLCCERCPENHPSCLHFHHRDQATKVVTISEAVRMRWKWEKIMEEIAKCEVLCANCHAKLHWQDGTLGKNRS